MDRINCTAVYAEYDTTRSGCRDIFNLCITRTKPEDCSAREFCSDECRSIYYKVLWCRNDTNHLTHLQRINLLCATKSADLNYPMHSTCLDISINFTATRGRSYGYADNCMVEVYGFACSGTCKNAMISYRNECCAINLAVEQNIRPGDKMYNEDLINTHTRQLWQHCQVETTAQMCPEPLCPKTTYSSPFPSPITELAGASIRHQANWIIFVITAAMRILLIYVYN